MNERQFRDADAPGSVEKGSAADLAYRRRALSNGGPTVGISGQLSDVWSKLRLAAPGVEQGLFAVRGIMGITRHLVAIGNCAEKEVIQ